MAQTLRVELVPSFVAAVTDPGGIFWKGHVEAWRKSFLGTAYAPVGEPRYHALPPSAISYIETNGNVQERNLDGLRTNWSNRTNWVNVRKVSILAGSIPDAQDDAKRLSEAGPFAGISQAGNELKMIVTIGVVIALGIGLHALYRRLDA